MCTNGKTSSYPELPLAPHDGPEAADALLWWLRKAAPRLREHVLPVYKQDVWHIIGRSGGGKAWEIARERGYDRFVCRTHKRIDCTDCACPACGAPGGCTCHQRRLNDYSVDPPLPREGNGRRVRIGTELTADTPETLQRVLAEYPWCHLIYESVPFCTNSLHEEPLRADEPYCMFELRIATSWYTDNYSDVANIFHRISQIPGVHVAPYGGLRVQIERDQDPSYKVLSRWIDVQEQVRCCFPTRKHNRFARPIDLNAPIQFHNQHGSLNISDDTMYECRIHPATSSWIVAICWTDWVHEFIRNNTSELGEAYLSARRAVDWRYPRQWRRAVETWHANHGSDYVATLDAIVRGEFKQWQI